MRFTLCKKKTGSTKSRKRSVRGKETWLGSKKIWNYSLKLAEKKKIIKKQRLHCINSFRWSSARFRTSFMKPIGTDSKAFKNVCRE